MTDQVIKHIPSSRKTLFEDNYTLHGSQIRLQKATQPEEDTWTPHDDKSVGDERPTVI